jgi:hypothetical protein
MRPEIHQYRDVVARDMFRDAVAIDLDGFRGEDGARTFAAAWLFIQALGLETVHGSAVRTANM